MLEPKPCPFCSTALVPSYRHRSRAIVGYAHPCGPCYFGGCFFGIEALIRRQWNSREPREMPRPPATPPDPLADLDFTL